MTTEKETPPVTAEGADMQSLEGQAKDTTGGVSLPEANRWDIEDPVVTEGRVPTWEEEVYQSRGFDRPPGLVGDIADYIYTSARRPAIEAALLAALGLMAGIAGRAYRIEDDGLNLYLLLLAGTGRGKEAMAKGIGRLVTGVRPNVALIDEFIGPRGFASGQALLRVAATRPCFVSIFGEFGHRLRTLSDPRAAPAEHMQLEILHDLYSKSGPDDALQPQAYADAQKNTNPVRSPAVTILCESYPDIIYDHIGLEEIRSGLLSRFIILDCDSPRPANNPNAGHAASAQLISDLCNLAATALAAHANDAINPPIKTIVEIDTKAKTFLDGVSNEIDHRYNNATDDVLRELWNRALQNIKRVAALLAIGVNHIKPVVTEECAGWALQLVEDAVQNMVNKFSSGAIGTGTDRRDGELRKYINDYLHLKPLKRNSSYHVQKRLADRLDLISYGYLRRRAKQCTAFTQHRISSDKALDEAIDALVKEGLIQRHNPEASKDLFGVCSTVLTLTCKPDEWPDVAGVQL